LHRFAGTSPFLVAVAAVAGIVGIAWVVVGATIRLPSAGLIGVAVFAATAGAAARVGAVVEGWLDVLGQAFDAAPEAQLVAAPDGRTVQVNLAFRRMFPGAGEAALDHIEKATADIAATDAFRALRHRAASSRHAAITIRLQAGHHDLPQLLEASVEPSFGHRGYRLWKFRDIAACDQEEAAALRRCGVAVFDSPGPERQIQPAAGHSNERFFADSPVGIAVIDRSGRFVRVNRALGDLFDVASDALIGRKLIGFLKPEDREAIAAKLAAAAKGREDRAPVEIRLAPGAERTLVLLLSRLDQPADASFIPAITGLRAVLTDASTPPPDHEEETDWALTLYFIDVTERKHLETQVAQSQKMQAVGQLAGGVAHDFNNLLTAMIGFCDLLLLRSRPGDPTFGDIMQIKQNANRAANLVRQLLAFARQQALQPRILDITDVLVELSHLLRRLIGENIELGFAHGRDLGLVKVDQGQLEQVVINLAVNARDAMPEGGKLTIRTANVHQAQAVRRGHETMPAGDYVLIEVADTGVGISPDNLARIFDPFFSTKSVGSGTGLGLSTVYGIVKQTGGFVFVDSFPGTGAAFAVYLPRHRAADEAGPARPDLSEPSIPRDLTGNSTVMLVEDDDAVRMFGARALRNKGYRVIEARSGEAALDLISNATTPIDLLVSDVVMPQMDGPALVREVRAIDPGIKVIFISGYAEDAFRQRLDNDSGIHFLPKPFSLKELAIKVKDVVSGEFARA